MGEGRGYCHITATVQRFKDLHLSIRIISDNEQETHDHDELSRDDVIKIIAFYYL